MKKNLKLLLEVVYLLLLFQSWFEGSSYIVTTPWHHMDIRVSECKQSRSPGVYLFVYNMQLVTGNTSFLYVNYTFLTITNVCILFCANGLMNIKRRFHLCSTSDICVRECIVEFLFFHLSYKFVSIKK